MYVCSLLLTTVAPIYRHRYTDIHIHLSFYAYIFSDVRRRQLYNTMTTRAAVLSKPQALMASV